MNQRITSIILLTLLGLTATACSFSFTTAKIATFNVGKNEKATPPASTFDAGEKVYAVADVSGAMGKHKMNFKATAENVAGKSKGDSVFEKSVDFEGSAPVGLILTLPVGGDYKVEAVLLDDAGKEIERKSATFSVKAAPAPAAPAAADEDSDKSSDDK